MSTDLSCVPDSIIKQYEPLCYKLASQFYGKDDMEDLVQAGRLGLATAYVRFDSSKGFAFITYAHKCILGYIRKHLRNHSRTIRIPYYRWGKYDNPLVTCSLEDIVTFEFGERDDLDDKLLVEGLLNSLTPRSRRILKLYHWMGLNNVEISRLIGVSPQQIVNIRNGAYKKLRLITGERI